MATTAAADGQRQYKRGRPGPHPYVGNSRPTHPMSSSTSPANLPGVYSNPDMAYALVAIVGCVVDVQMQSGVAYQGVLRAVSPMLSVALALATDKTKEPTTENTVKLMQLEFADIVSVSVLPDANPTQTNIFKTDTEISRTNGSGYAKELQPFAFEELEATAMTLTDQSSGWSAEAMFETNKSKFNVESSFNEEMIEYTTQLDRMDTKDFRVREQRADRLAREIEDSVDKHWNSDIGTEEELFSAVVRQDVAPPPSNVPKPKQVPAPTTASLRCPLPSTGGATRMVSDGRSYSAVAETALEPRPSGKGGSDPANSSQSQQGTNSSSLSGGSSQEFLHTTDMDSMNPKGGWTSQEESGLSLSGENSYLEKGPLSTALEEGSQESLGQATMEDEEGEGQEMKGEDRLQETIQAATEVGAEAQGEGMIEEATVPASSVAETCESANKEEKVRKFQLDPNARTFSFNLGAKEFVPSSFTPPSNTSPLLTQSSSSPSVLESSSYHPPPHSHDPAAGKKYAKRLHNHTSSATSTQYVPQELLGYISPTGNIVYSPTHHSLIRNSVQQVPNQQMVQYSSSVPQFVSSYPSAGGFVPQSQTLVAPQHMVNNGQKFDINPVFAGNQYSTMHMAPHQLMQQQQQAHGQLLASVSPASGALVTTPPSGNPPMMMVQGGQGHMGSMYPQMPAMAQVGQTQVLGQNRYVQIPPN